MSKCFIIALPEEVENINEINGIPVYYSNVGKLNSSILTYELINSGFTEIINIGSCGSKNHKVGELLKVGRVYQDIDVTPIYEFGLTSNDVNSISLCIDPLSDISCFSTDYFYDHNQISKYSKHYLNSIERYSIFDMECYSQAKICLNKNIKYSSYKWVSDEGSFDNWLKNCKIGFNNFIKSYSSIF
jgi:nucleoside phosphorylase